MLTVSLSLSLSHTHTHTRKHTHIHDLVLSLCPYAVSPVVLLLANWPFQSRPATTPIESPSPSIPEHPTKLPSINYTPLICTLEPTMAPFSHKASGAGSS
ncbi:hypothetical protein ILYODFUR_037979 [Ilyodon furcidens]|uniref:Uncharacterized protein n=1 Tax=Ilyodon furcidens TaxID=33524 RepID=A0ABV0UYJ7_9TELE